MRGKEMLSQKEKLLSGITPAYAGKRSKKSVLNAIMQDHPRLCGEKGRIIQMSKGYAGSPPPMRGKAKNAGGGNVGIRITPAYAGKRSIFWQFHCWY